MISRFRFAVAVLCAVPVLLAGCGSLPGMKQDAVTTELSSEKPLAQPPPYRAPDDTKPITLQNGAKTHADVTMVPGTGQLINTDAAAQPQAGSGGKNGPGEITFNFENLPIQAVVQNILGGLLNENYTISPAVAGNVTFSSSRPVSTEQALPILEMLLAWTNNALVRKPGRYEVVPIKDAIAGNLSPSLPSVKAVPGYQLRVFPLKFISAKELEKLLKPYAKPDAIVSADSARAMIVLAGTPLELQNYERTINVFDVDWLQGMSIGVIGLRNMDVTKLIPELEKVLGDKSDTPVSGMFRFLPMEATNSIIVITPQPEYLKRAQEWIYRLDLGVSENSSQLYVYDVKNVKSVDLADHLNMIFTGKGGGTRSNSGNTAPGLRGSTIGSSLSSGIGSGAMSINNGGSTQQRPPTASNLTTTGSGTAMNGTGSKKGDDIRITAIEENNQVLTMATPSEYESILAVIKRLDVPPLQVQIEAKVLEVQLNGTLSYGVQWWFQGLINNSQAGSGTSSPQYQSSYLRSHELSLGGGGSATPSTSGGVFYSYLNKNFQVAINALLQDNQAKTLSAPSMVVLNNQQASITVGDQIPITTYSYNPYGTTTTTTTGATSLSTVGSSSYVSTGTTLQITPRVNPGGLVYMDVDQEITGSVPNSTNSQGNPEISQRSFQTSLSVQSGQTVLLGGMIGEDDSDSNTGVPLLSSIPWIGNLFKSSTKTRNRTEIIVLITPTVIYNAEDAKTVTDEYQDKFESLAPLRAKKKEPQAKAAASDDAQDAVATPLPGASAPTGTSKQ